jgi:hypothetical protein
VCLSSSFELTSDRLDHLLLPLKHVLVGETEDHAPQGAKQSVTFAVSRFAPDVTIAIDLDDEPCFHAIEVEYERLHRVLATKPAAPSVAPKALALLVLGSGALHARFRSALGARLESVVSR